MLYFAKITNQRELILNTKLNCGKHIRQEETTKKTGNERDQQFEKKASISFSPDTTIFYVMHLNS